MKALCDLYIRRARLIGALYCIVPVLIWFAVIFLTIPFREVYLLRVALAIVAGGAVSAYVNERGLALWLIKHRSKEGPATVFDGMMIGAGVGLSSAMLAPLTGLIATHHLEEAKTFIICSYLAGIVLGGLVGSILAVIGRQQIASGAAEKQ
ncbi:MAG: hypothetical protein NTX50_28690 [Candidatus Sumerlaeota bacterium]|nr:hypothetical protein [Candidatus Sumerlaeota bacterium]